MSSKLSRELTAECWHIVRIDFIAVLSKLEEYGLECEVRQQASLTMPLFKYPKLFCCSCREHWATSVGRFFNGIYYEYDGIVRDVLFGMRRCFSRPNDNSGRRTINLLKF